MLLGSCSPFSKSSPVYQTTAPSPPGGGVGQVVCEEGGGESGLKGHILLRATGLAMLLVVESK